MIKKGFKFGIGFVFGEIAAFTASKIIEKTLNEYLKSIYLKSIENSSKKDKSNKETDEKIVEYLKKVNELKEN